MALKKLANTDGFMVYDFPDVPSSGVVRRARKILQSSATDLARSATYGFAFHQVQRSGASGGLNAEGDETGPAMDAMLAELAEPLGSGDLVLHPGKGVAAAELGTDASAASELLVAGVLAATEWALGRPVEGATAAIEGTGPVATSLASAATARGMSVVEPAADAKPWEIWGSDVDVLLVGSKPGAMNHQGADLVAAKVVVPYGPIPITTKALAVLIRRTVTYVPDFVAASGPIVAGHLDGGPATAHDFAALTDERLTAVAADSDEPLFLSCCHEAEQFLATWRDKLPFGRPLAG